MVVASGFQVLGCWLFLQAWQWEEWQLGSCWLWVSCWLSPPFYFTALLQIGQAKVILYCVIKLDY